MVENSISDASGKPPATRPDTVSAQKFNHSTLKFGFALKSIIEKYGKTESENGGDIIDLETGEVIEDNGHLSSLRDAPMNNIWNEVESFSSEDEDTYGGDIRQFSQSLSNGPAEMQVTSHGSNFNTQLVRSVVSGSGRVSKSFSRSVAEKQVLNQDDRVLAGSEMFSRSSRSPSSGSIEREILSNPSSQSMTWAVLEQDAFDALLTPSPASKAFSRRGSYSTGKRTAVGTSHRSTEIRRPDLKLMNTSNNDHLQKPFEGRSKKRNAGAEETPTKRRISSNDYMASNQFNNSEKHQREDVLLTDHFQDTNDALMYNNSIVHEFSLPDMSGEKSMFDYADDRAMEIRQHQLDNHC